MAQGAIFNWCTICVLVVSQPAMLDQHVRISDLSHLGSVRVASEYA